MFSNNRKIIWFLIVAVACLIGRGPTVASAQQAKKPFTVADEIGLTTFGLLYTAEEESVQSSPDGNYFAVDTVRGRLDLNCVEGSLRFYRSQDIENYLKHPDEIQIPSPIWIASRCEKKGPVFSGWRWLADASGVAFLESTSSGNHRLMLADLRRKMVEPLTSATEEVSKFDVRDRNNYIYTAADLMESKNKINAARQAPAVVGTGRTLEALVFPNDPLIHREVSPRKFLRAVVGGKGFEVKHNGAPLAAGGDIALSPDGHWLVTTLPVSEVPPTWETLYPPSYPPSSPDFEVRIRAGRPAHQYVRIHLQRGSVEALIGAPIGDDAGWWTLGGGSWSSDGQAILLPDTFLKSKENAPSRPCVAVVDLPSTTSTCVEILKRHTENGGVEEGYHMIWAASFASGDRHRVKVTFMTQYYHTFQTTEYRQSLDGTWQVVEHDGLGVSVKQGTNEPPQLVATDKQVPRVIWDPNPQLKDIELGEVNLYQWRDKEGREWRGGLYRPTNYKPGRRYPLVIQTHGFNEGWFWTSGGFPTAFAARELAAAGIMVLQVVANTSGVYCPDGTPEEGPCAVSFTESAAEQLVSDGLVDPERIGVIGFSRTCYLVMEMLTKSSVHLKAASITDGVMFDTDEHILTNPAVRMASQGGSVDWFRFWLQDYEDPDPAKAEQYVRWRELRKLQEANEKKSTAPQSALKLTQACPEGTRGACVSTSLGLTPSFSFFAPY